MDQGVIVAFKADCLRNTFARVIAATEENTEKTLLQFWKDCNIYDHIPSLARAWGDVTKEFMNDIWLKSLIITLNFSISPLIFSIFALCILKFSFQVHIHL